MYVILILSAVAFLAFLWAFRGKIFFDDSEKTKIKKRNKNQQKPHSKCPICNSDLFPGENLTTRLYKGSDPKQQSVTIHGCPYCYPLPKIGVKRTCPVCFQEIPLSGYLDAYLFNRENGKKHVHVTGCTECHKKNKK